MKSPHCLCLKIKFYYVLANFSMVVNHTNTPSLGKKILCHDIIWWCPHFFESCLACFCHFGDFFFFLVFHVTLSVLMINKWNFAVIFTANDTWVVKRLKFGSYCMINCGETSNDIFCFLNGCRLTSYLKLMGELYWSLRQPFSFLQLLSVILLASRMHQKRAKWHKHCKTIHT